MNYLIVDKIIENALLEDRAFDDVTTLNIVDDKKECTVQLIAKEDGVLCGLDVFARVFEKFGGVEIEFLKFEGEAVKNKELIAKLKGKVRSILSGERIALNLLQKMSGIATETNNVAKIFDPYGIKVMDTRKTTPNLRYIEKYSVKVGGGFNHRYDLADMAMIKDNHIMAAGGITEAVTAIRRAHPFIKNIEVETETLDHVKEAVEAGADIIMLDNMDRKTMQDAIKIIDGKAIIEASGNIDERLDQLEGLKIDYISIGKLTHSVKALDISMKNLRLI